MNSQPTISKETLQKIAEIFFPSALQRQQEVKSKGKRFVHYTSAQAAMSILSKREVWMRQPSCMNDFMEIEHGIQCLGEAYRKEPQIFKGAIENVYNGLSEEIEQSFDELINNTRRDLYLLCVSEHETSDDDFGRLSMWRAYGKGTGVAIVFKQYPFFKESNVLKAYSTPVEYLKSDGFHLLLEQIAKNISQSTELLRSVGKPQLKILILNTLRFLVLSTKHCGFSEEREWRVIYSPNVEKSSHLVHSIETIDGIPQEIYKFCLKDNPSAGITGFDLNELIDRVIIGPSEFPFAVYKVFVKLLSDVGIANAHSKVVISDIPLRRR